MRECFLKQTLYAGNWIAPNVLPISRRQRACTDVIDRTDARFRKTLKIASIQPVGCMGVFGAFSYFHFSREGLANEQRPRLSVAHGMLARRT